MHTQQTILDQTKLNPELIQQHESNQTEIILPESNGTNKYRYM